MEQALVALLGQVVDAQRAVGAHARADLDDVRVDLGAPQGAGHRDAVVAVAHEVDLADLEERDRRHRLAAAHGVGDPLPARPHARGGGTELAIEALGAVDGAEDRVQRHGAQPDVGLLEVAERGHHLVVGQDDVDVAGSRPTRRARRDMTCRRRTRWKSSWASAEGKPVSRGGRKAPSRYPSPRRPHHATLDNPTPTAGGLYARAAAGAVPARRRSRARWWARRPRGWCTCPSARSSSSARRSDGRSPRAAPCAPRGGSATLGARMTFSLALRLLILPPRGE